MLIQINFDGGCVPNPGRGYGSYEITSDKWSHRVERMDFGWNCTNNMTEYMSLIAALKWLRHFTDKTEHLRIYTDSNLVQGQLRGRTRVKVEHIKELWAETLQLLLPYERWEINWQPRKHNVKRFGH